MTANEEENHMGEVTRVLTLTALSAKDTFRNRFAIELSRKQRRLIRRTIPDMEGEKSELDTHHVLRTQTRGFQYKAYTGFKGIPSFALCVLHC